MFVRCILAAFFGAFLRLALFLVFALTPPVFPAGPFTIALPDADTLRVR
jgi:hypothetical protein